MNAIKRTSEVLKLLADRPRRFTGIVRELQLTKSTAHRLLRGHEQADLINKNPLSGRHNLRPLIPQLAAFPISEHQALIICSIEAMRKLRDLSEEIVNLQIPLGPERLRLEKIQSMEHIKYVSEKNQIYPIVEESVGQMLLSMMHDDQIATFMRK